MAQSQDRIANDHIYAALRRINDPQSGRDIVTAGWVGEVQSRFGNVAITLHLPPDSKLPEAELRSACIGAIKQVAGVQSVLPNITRKPKPKAPAQENTSNIKHLIVVGSGKGGVGKSTTSVNLALALAQQGHKVGLLDGDIYGPSVPTMLAKGHDGEIGDPDKVRMRDNLLVPFEMFGIKVMSVAMLIEKDQPTVWRAPIATKMINQFLGGTDWGDLDFLIVDLPPGTGDIQLTLSQQANVDGAIITTTPQKVALNIARKGLLMFQHVGVPIVGIVETMSGFGCDNCGSVTQIFGEGGAKALSAETGIPLLAQVPLDAALVRAGDEGEPIVRKDPDAASAKAYLEAARQLVTALQAKPADAGVVPVAVEGVPQDPQNDGRHSVAIYWSDGMKYVYDARYLRYRCPCAGCVDEFTGERKIKFDDVDPDIYIDKALPVGRYGVNLVWTDSHSTGIYTYSTLRDLECRKFKERPQPEPGTTSSPGAV